MKEFLHYISHHRFLTLGIYLIVFVAFTIGFVEIAEEITEGETLWIDEAILHAINGFASPFWDTFFVVITQFGGVLGVIAITAGILLLLLNRRKYKEATIIATIVSGAALLNVVLKLIFERPRPDLWEQLIIETSHSFPSGHAMISAALGLGIILICWSTKYRWPSIIVSSVYILLIGFSRLYLGVHYPTDILGGWLMSGAWVAVVGLVFYSRSLYKESRNAQA